MCFFLVLQQLPNLFDGASLSGNAHWKDTNGKTLKELLETE